MLKQNNYSEYNTSKGQISLFPGINTIITQGPGVTLNGTTFNYDENNPDAPYALSHQFYRALDIKTDDKNLRAPFDCKCVYFSYEGFGNVCTAAFQSLNPVITPSDPGNPCHVTFIVEHGGPDINVDGEDEDGYTVTKLSVGTIVRQGNILYQEGTEGPVGEHIHINVMKKEWESLDEDISYIEKIDGYYNGEYYCYSNIAYLTHECNVEEVFYLEKDELAPELSWEAAVWDGYINFMTYVPFNPRQANEGWNTHLGETYYVVGGECLIGKQKLLEPGGAEEFIYVFDREGRMLKNGIKTYGVFKYSLHPDGKARVSEWFSYPEEPEKIYYAKSTAALARNGWLEIDSTLYYFKLDCSLAVNEWIVEDDVPKYYVDSTGARVKGWLEVAYPGSDKVHWFYFNNPNDYKIKFLEPGEKATRRWIASGSYWYYVNDDGKMLVNSWIFDSTYNAWYFVLSDGKMAYSCQIRCSDGKYYGFDESGKCLGKNGSTEKLDEEKYPLVMDYTQS